MKYWSIWDDQILRALRGAFASMSPELTIVPGFEGGVALWLSGDLAGHWTATGRETFAFLPLSHELQPRNDVALLDIIDATHQLLWGLFPDKLDPLEEMSLAQLRALRDRLDRAIATAEGSEKQGLRNRMLPRTRMSQLQ